jgi:hypothetical protein
MAQHDFLPDKKTLTTFYARWNVPARALAQQRTCPFRMPVVTKPKNCLHCALQPSLSSNFYHARLVGCALGSFAHGTLALVLFEETFAQAD